MLLRRQQAASDRPPRLRVVDDAVDDAAGIELSSRAYALAIAGAVALGFLVRAGFVLGSGFPLNDGGLFYQMVRDLQHAHYAIPDTTTYNGDSLPFVYPPLGLYLAAMLNDVTGMGLATVFRVVPLVASTLTIGAFFLLARDMLKSRVAVIAAVFVFAVVPRSFLWLIMGGGVTRSFGLLFALLTMHAAHAMYTRADRRYAALAALFAALAFLCHIEMAWFAAFSSGLFFLAYGRNRAGVDLDPDGDRGRRGAGRSVAGADDRPARREPIPVGVRRGGGLLREPDHRADRAAIHERAALPHHDGARRAGRNRLHRGAPLPAAGVAPRYRAARQPCPRHRCVGAAGAARGHRRQPTCCCRS